MDTTQIIILAAGKGSRMRGDIPKALTQLGHQSMIEHVIDTLEPMNLTLKPIVVVGYKGEMIQEVLGDRVRYTFQDEPKGTGHAVRVALPQVPKEAEKTIILYADQPFITRETLELLEAEHQEGKGALTIATALIEDDELFETQFVGFGRIVRDDDGEICSIVEAKDASPEEREIREVNPAYFCCNTDWLRDSLESLDNDNSQGEYYLTDLVKIAFASHYHIGSVLIHQKEALGANTPEQLAVLTTYLTR